MLSVPLVHLNSRDEHARHSGSLTTHHTRCCCVRYHIQKRVCDKLLERMRKHGRYWDGKKELPIPPDKVFEPTGALSPGFPTLDMLGFDKTQIAKVTAKV